MSEEFDDISSWNEPPFYEVIVDLSKSTVRFVKEGVENKIQKRLNSI